jgi:hypothetical protein
VRLGITAFATVGGDGLLRGRGRWRNGKPDD